MERKINEELLKWKRDANKKILLLYGKRQIGKTYSTLSFGESNYKNIVYFDTTNNLVLYEVFKREKTIDKIIFKLSMLSSESILDDDTLIIFDNCNDEEFLKYLKVFNNYSSKYNIIAITSRRDVLNKVKNEEFRYCNMHGMDFEEFLLNSDKKQLIDFIKDSYQTLKPMPFHQLALDMYNDYLVTGGFPEVVNAYFNNESYYKQDAIKQNIYSVYLSETPIGEEDVNSQRNKEVINSLPYQLLKDNHKFQYGLIKKGGRSKEYENSINYLTHNSLVNRSYRLLDIKSPLSSYKDLESFRLYANDSGLLVTMMHLNKMKLITDNTIRRSVIENNVANTLVSFGHSLYYYQSDGKAEISFVIQNKFGKIIPVEIVNPKLLKAKSLSLFLSKYNMTSAIKITEENFSKRKEIISIPVYATFCLRDL